jgi:predicted house-cleaning NTP pyrophosphatase (Maf/HAM1 superfamily)
VHPSAIDEKCVRDADPAALTRKLAEAKAWKVVKPRDSEEAAAFLRELSDSAFQFVTSLVVIRSDTRKMLSTVEISQIKFRRLEDHEVHDYVSRYPVLRYAGLSKARVFCASRTQSQAATTS